MSEPKHNLSLTGAQKLVRVSVPVVGMESTGLMGGLGRIVRQDVFSKRDYPAADSAGRDGFCFKASSTSTASSLQPVILQLRGTMSAGEEPRMRIGRGDSARIMTGGVLPEGADAVLPAEDAEAKGGRLKIVRPVEPGTHVCRSGETARVGEKVAGRGDLMSPGLMGLLAAVGIQRMKVSRRVRIGIICTGNEIVRAGASLRPWQAPNSNSLMLSGLVEGAGSEAVNLGIAGDSLEEIIGHLRTGRGCDMVVLTGGSSEGCGDLVLDALQSYGAGILLRGIRLRPGRHVIFARKGRRSFFGLPGRPAGCFALFHMLVKPAIIAMMGSAKPLPVAIRAVWDAKPTPKPAVNTLLAADLGPRSRVRPVSDTRSGDLAGLARANSLVLLKPGRGSLRKGEAVEVFRTRFPVT